MRNSGRELLRLRQLEAAAWLCGIGLSYYLGSYSISVTTSSSNGRNYASKIQVGRVPGFQWAREEGLMRCSLGSRFYH